MQYPTSIAAIRRFLGLINWIKDYLPKVHQFTIPFYDILSKTLKEKDKYKQKLIIKQTELIAEFQRIKEVLAFPLQLHAFNPASPIFVATDASVEGFGGILFHRDNENRKLIFSIMSGRFNSTQRKWDTIEQEAFAVYKTIVSNPHYLLGRPFTLLTDNQPLVYILTSPSRKIDRWKRAMQIYEFQTYHIAGAENEEPDSLSRIFYDIPPSEVPLVD
jgi:hypothetical protein